MVIKLLYNIGIPSHNTAKYLQICLGVGGRCIDIFEDKFAWKRMNDGDDETSLSEDEMRGVAKLRTAVRQQL